MQPGAVDVYKRQPNNHSPASFEGAILIVVRRFINGLDINAKSNENLKRVAVVVDLVSILDAPPNLAANISMNPIGCTADVYKRQGDCK